MAYSLTDRKAQEWRQRLMRFEKSRHTVGEFCRREGVSPPSFYLWRRRLASRPEATQASPPPPAGFRAVRLLPAAALTVQLPGGTQLLVPLSDPDTLRAVIEAVGCVDAQRGKDAPAMLSFAPNVRIFLHACPTDMRKSFDGLCGLVRSVLKADPLDGSLFLFVNRRGDRLKAMWWDRDGLALFYKRLEAGTFEMLRPEGEAQTIEIDATQLALLLSGVCLASAKRRKRYARAG